MHSKIFALLAVVSVATCRDLIVGNNNAGVKIYEDNNEASPALWRQDNNVTINATNGEVISRIVVTDLRAEKDGEVTIVEGGEGHSHVTLKLKSPTALRGYSFHIEVYARNDLNGTLDSVDENSNVTSNSDVAQSNNDTATNQDALDVKPAADSSAVPPALAADSNVRQARNDNGNLQKETSTQKVPEVVAAGKSGIEGENADKAVITPSANEEPHSGVNSSTPSPAKPQDKITNDTAEVPSSTQIPIAPSVLKDGNLNQDAKNNEDNPLKTLIDIKRFMHEEHGDDLDLTHVNDTKIVSPSPVASATQQQSDNAKIL